VSVSVGQCRQLLLLTREKKGVERLRGTQTTDKINQSINQ
jgi:hypothetical protein